MSTIGRIFGVASLAVAFVAGCGSSSDDGGAGGAGEADASVDSGDASSLDADAAGDGGGDEPTGDAASDAALATHVLFALPASLDELAGDTFLDHPWPSDARLDADGTPHWAGFRNPRALAILDEYAAAVDGRVRGFSPVAAGYLRFDGALDPATLPAGAAASVGAASSVALVDVDEASPERGTRKLVHVELRADEGVYWQANTLAWAPEQGFPLRPATRYALVVTTAVRDAEGRALVAPTTLREVLGLDAPSSASQALHDAWVKPIAELRSAGIPEADVAALAVFTTSDPTAELEAVRDDVRANVAPPTADASKWKKAEGNADYQAYEGEYGPSPDYQLGTPPFATSGSGGDFAFDSGKPAVQRLFSLRFALVVPSATACPPPADGYPVVLYAHGTGGDYRSFVRDGTARSLARSCLASMGIDQIFHGTRPGAPVGSASYVETQEEILFFNFQNPAAARTNGRQAAIDEVQRARLFTESHLEVPAATTGGAAVRFDATKVLFFGHSQGGLNGPLFLAVDDGARGGVLSGSGSMISVSLLLKTKPDPSVANLVATVFLGLKPAEIPELSSLSPPMALAQTLVDAEDPIHYVRHLFASPRPGMAPKSIYQTEGVRADFTGDSFTPPPSIEIQAIATGLPVQNPVIHPLGDLALAGLANVDVPAGGLAHNLAGGKASGVLAQWLPVGDGHFVVFDVAAARAQAAGFLRNLADDPYGTVPAP